LIIYVHPTSFGLFLSGSDLGCCIARKLLNASLLSEKDCNSLTLLLREFNILLEKSSSSIFPDIGVPVV